MLLQCSQMLSNHLQLYTWEYPAERVAHPDMHGVVQATTHAEQQGALHTERLTALQDQLEQANGQVLNMELSAKHAGSQQSSLKAQRDDLQRKLTVCEGEIRELESKLSAACMESSGGVQPATLCTVGWSAASMN